MNCEIINVVETKDNIELIIDKVNKNYRVGDKIKFTNNVVGKVSKVELCKYGNTKISEITVKLDRNLDIELVDYFKFKIINE